MDKNYSMKKKFDEGFDRAKTLVIKDTGVIELPETLTMTAFTGGGGKNNCLINSNNSSFDRTQKIEYIFNFEKLEIGISFKKWWHSYAVKKATTSCMNKSKNDIFSFFPHLRASFFLASPKKKAKRLAADAAVLSDVNSTQAAKLANAQTVAAHHCFINICLKPPHMPQKIINKIIIEQTNKAVA